MLKIIILLIYSRFLSEDAEFESPQFKPNDPLEDFNGKLVSEMDGIDHGEKISIYVKKSRFQINSTFPKMMIVDAFYETNTDLADDKSKVSIETVW